MKTLKCLAVDDEPHALELLENYVAKVPFLEMHKTTSSPWEALTILKQATIDLVFIDIQMDELTGLQMMDAGQINCPIIITSAYSEYAIDGFNHQVSDYLLKPYSFERFLKAVNKVFNEQLGDLAKSAPITGQEPTPDHIFIKGDAKNKYHQVRYEDILYIEGLKNYVQFNCENERITTLQNMKDLEQSLPKALFMRVHRSFIINLKNIKQVDGNTIYIEQQQIPIGQSYRPAFFAFLKKK